MRKFLIPAAALIAIAGGSVVIAQGAATPGTKDVAKVTGGTYAVEPSHTQIVFAYDHMGFTNNLGVIAQPTGTLTLDKANPAASKVSIEVPIANLTTGIPALNEHLAKPEFFDVAKFPKATFVSTGVKTDGPTGATITGNLTIKGITKPVTLDAEFYGAGANPMNKKENIGFVATGTIKRSDFGMGMAVPVVGDAVELKIIAAFQK
ncbi:YceI family protein [Sphingobium limneticum]|uniref:YceI family protein n=1 Tax=Sphingobium limneticum TaxID=1007511 RepID=A0A5J5I705_9SPHN|nr:YceI family protein [Sphingobium limneticum]KAA9020606.1 YceI family protein [Sphingobium limneticum]KAA9032931.1 YceI family protein [Sphingobium limneticum]